MSKKSVLDTNSDLYISISICGDKEIQSLNKKYFKRDYPTDVLSFNVDESIDGGKYYLGDIVVNKEQAKRQASEFENDTQHEISELVAHGVLHLLGVHHPDDDEHSVHGVEKK